MAQLDAQAPVVADDSALSSDSGADTTTLPADQQQPGKDDEPADGTGFYKDDQPDEGEGGEPGEGAEGEGAEGEGEGDPQPIAPPASWNDEDKAVFAQLPKEAQETIARRETERDKYLRGKAQEHQQAQAKILATAREQLTEIHTRKAQEYRQLAAQFQPQPPDQRLLYTGNPQDGLAYQQQEASYRNALAQQQDLQHRAQSEIEEAKAVAQAQEQQAAITDLKSLAENQPDWFEEGTLNLKGEVISRLEPIGEALGYSPELMAQANSRDLQALHAAHDWKVKADKWDALQKSKMAVVRDAKKAPTLAKPGAARHGNIATDDPLKLLYPND